MLENKMQTVKSNIKQVFETVKNRVIQEHRPLLILTLLFLVNVFLFKYKMTELYMDFGKEAYLSKAVLDGGVIYKDLLPLFGPFAYLLNAVVMKIFGVHLTVLYLAGALNAYFLMVLLYIISRNFLSKTISTLICIFVLYNCAFVPHLMNYLTPYSYGVVYGMSAVMLSVVLFLNYLKTNNKAPMYLSLLFAGVAAANKYDFFVYGAFVLFYCVFKNRNPKTVALSVLSLAAVPLIITAFLFMQGLTFTEFFNYVVFWLKFASSSDIKDYYTGTFYFSSKYFLIMLKSLGISAVLFAAVFYAAMLFEKIKNAKLKYSAYALLCGGLYYLFYTYNIFVLMCVPNSLTFVVSILLIVKIKDIIKNEAVFFLCASAILVGIKTYFYLLMNQYGRYFLPLLLVSLLVVLFDFYFKEKTKPYLKNTVIIMLVLMSVLRLVVSNELFEVRTAKIQTDTGIVLREGPEAQVYNSIIRTIDIITDKNDTVVALPEAPLINFLTGRKSDTYNYLIPVLVRLYGEQNIINHYKNAAPEAFVILTDENDQGAFCRSWGTGICSWVGQNYRIVQTIKADKLILILQKI